jgi:hypothetical protein
MSDTYELRVKGHLGDRWSHDLGGLAVRQQQDGTTVLTGSIVDQAALHGVIIRIRDLGLPLLSVRRIDTSGDRNVFHEEGIMKTGRGASRALEDVKVDVKLKLAALWASVMFLYIYVDYFGFFKPEFIEDILVGRVWQFDVTQAFLLGALASVTIPALMIFLSVGLPAKANRWTNIVVAAIYIPFSLFNLAGEAWAFMVFGAAVEVVLLVLIIGYAWKWPGIETRNE